MVVLFKRMTTMKHARFVLQSTLICCTLAYTYSKSLTKLYRSYFWVLGHLWSQHDVIMSWLRLTSTSNCIPHPYYTYNMFEHIGMLSIGIQQQHYTVLPTLLGSDFEVLGHLWSQHDVIMSWLRLTATSN